MSEGAISEISILSHIKEVEDELSDLKQNFITALTEYLNIAISGTSPDELKMKIQEVHQVGVKYFSRAEGWVAESDILNARQNRTWNLLLTESCYSVLRTYLKYWESLKSESEKVGEDLQKRFSPHPRAYKLMQAMIRVYYPKRWEELREAYSQAGLPTSGFDNENIWRELIVKQPSDHGKMTPQLWALYGFGIVFIIILLGLVVTVENLTNTQNFYFRVVMALAAGAIGALIPGLFSIEAKVVRNSVRAGGAAAFFVAVYFMNPPSILGDEQPKNTPTEQVQSR